MSVRPDIIAEVLEVSRFSTLFYGRYDLGAPWAFAVPAKTMSVFYVVVEGSAHVTVDGMKGETALTAGDIVLLPRGLGGHRLDDGSARGRRMPPVASNVLLERKAPSGNGPRTTLISGCFRFSAGASHPLLRSLPPIVHFPGDDVLAAMVKLIALESAAPGPGSSVILARMTECLLVHALRTRSTEEGDGLRALSDPTIASALERMHAAPAEAWTVERLAAAVGLSRSGFAARFQALVGEPPLRYLTQWRVLRAATLLTETVDSVDSIAERLGYVSGPAFQKAFKRWQGVGPGAYRRAARATEPGVTPSTRRMQRAM